MAKRLLEFDGKLLHAHAVSEAIAQDAPSHGLADLFFKVDGRLHRDQTMAQIAGDGNALGLPQQAAALPESLNRTFMPQRRIGGGGDELVVVVAQAGEKLADAA